MSNSPISILLLEDDLSLGSALTRAMQNRGHTLCWERDLPGLHTRCESAGEFDLVLMDLKLEQGSSLNQISKVRARYPKAKILVVTGYASIATTVEAIKQGADDYLPKPVSVEEILKAYRGGEEGKEPPEEEDPVLSTRQLEWEHIQRVLMENDGNISKTAKKLDMHRRTLQRKLQKKSK